MLSLEKKSVVISKKTEIEPYSRPMSISSPSYPTADGFFFPMPTGETKGDITYWNPDAGESGAWVKLDAPNLGSGDDPVFLKFNGNLEWGEGGGGSGLPSGAIAKEFDVCENGQPRTWWFLVWENQPNLTPSE